MLRAVSKPDTLVIQACQAWHQHVARSLQRPVSDSVRAGCLIRFDGAKGAEHLMLLEFWYAKWLGIVISPEVIQAGLRGRWEELAGKEVSFLPNPVHY